MMRSTDSELQRHLYLEEVSGEQALEKVRAWNARSLKHLQGNPLYEELYAQALAIVNSKDKIPYVSCRDGVVHNFWQDADHVRGIWRCTTINSYLTDSPDWQTVLDIDALSAAEDSNWVYRGNSVLGPENDLCMVCLSDGGKDASVYREFNIRTRSFVDNGFATKESKGSVSWLDKDHLLVGLDFGEDEAGNTTLTDSGYPMIAKLWRRGTPLEDATELGCGEKTDVMFSASVVELTDKNRQIILTRSTSFYDRQFFWLPVDWKDAVPQFADKVHIPLPSQCGIVGLFKEQMLVSLREDWRGYRMGSLVSFSFTEFMEGADVKDVHLIWSAGDRASVNNCGITRAKLLVSISENVTGSAYAFDWDGQSWSSERLQLPTLGSVQIGWTHHREDTGFISTDSFLVPGTLWKFNSNAESNSNTSSRGVSSRGVSSGGVSNSAVSSGTASSSTAPNNRVSVDLQSVKSLPEWFDSSSMIAEQFEVASTDGTMIPYFVVRQNGMAMNSHNPTLLYGYGGFQVPLNPTYSAIRGTLWIERGGVYVHANIRGGGEFGPAWHQAGLKTKRQCIYDDFIAVAEDLFERRITSPAHLGIEGASNGGLLVGVMLTQRPELFAAVVCAVPLLDMLRYHLLLAGASWVGEYGDPDDAAEGEFLKSISPYHNVQADTRYPEVFFVTSTKDDRVHPAHARKMAARFEDLGHDFLYYENIDGGHSAAANLAETARRVALQHTFLFEKLSA
jgi:prolyl oligopeptidase